MCGHSFVGGERELGFVGSVGAGKERAETVFGDASLAGRGLLLAKAGNNAVVATALGGVAKTGETRPGNEEAVLGRKESVSGSDAGPERKCACGVVGFSEIVIVSPNSPFFRGASGMMVIGGALEKKKIKESSSHYARLFENCLL